VRLKGTLADQKLAGTIIAAPACEAMLTDVTYTFTAVSLKLEAFIKIWTGIAKPKTWYNPFGGWEWVMLPYSTSLTSWSSGAKSIDLL